MLASKAAEQIHVSLYRESQVVEDDAFPEDSADFKLGPFEKEELLCWGGRSIDLLHHIKIATLQVVADSIYQYASGLAAASPRMDTIIGDDLFLRGPAKKTLLGWRGRTAFTDNTVRLLALSQKVKQVHTDFKLQRALNDLAIDAVKGTTAAYKTCNHLVTVLCHLNVILGLSGNEQRDEAAALLVKPAKVPQPLIDALNEIVNTKGKKRKTRE